MISFTNAATSDDGISYAPRRDDVTDFQKLKINKSCSNIVKTDGIEDLKIQQKIFSVSKGNVGTQASNHSELIVEVPSKGLSMFRRPNHKVKMKFTTNEKCLPSEIHGTNFKRLESGASNSFHRSDSCYLMTLVYEPTKSDLYSHIKDSKNNLKFSSVVSTVMRFNSKVPISRKFSARWRRPKAIKNPEDRPLHKDFLPLPISFESQSSEYFVRFSSFLGDASHRRLASYAATARLSYRSVDSCYGDSGTESDSDSEESNHFTSISNSFASNHCTSKPCLSNIETVRNLATVIVQNSINIAIVNVGKGKSVQGSHQRSLSMSALKAVPESSIPALPPFPLTRARAMSMFSSDGDDLLEVKSHLRRTSSPLKLSPLNSINSSPVEEDSEQREIVLNELHKILEGDAIHPKLEAHLSDFTGGVYLGRGRSASVRTAMGNDGENVALKEFCYLRKDPPLAVLQGFLLEVEAMRALANCQYIVQLYGIWLEPKPCLVMELLEDGSLHDVLVSNIDESEAASKWANSTGQVKLDLIRQAATGLAEMHSRNVVHRDIKSHNIVVALREEGWIAKIADFGSSVIVDEAGLTTGCAGTSGWSAPEIFHGDPYSLSCDVFSLGVLIWESGWIGDTMAENPLCGLAEVEYVAKLTSGLRPPILKTNNFGIPFEAYETLLNQCWAQNPSLRMSSSDVVSFLSGHVR